MDDVNKEILEKIFPDAVIDVDGNKFEIWFFGSAKVVIEGGDAQVTFILPREDIIGKLKSIGINNIIVF